VPAAGRVVAITGGARGIGRAAAEQLLARGARVAVGYLDPDAAADLVARHPGRAVSLPLDVTDEASFAGFLAAAEGALGPVDVLVNNAGIMPIGPFLEEPAGLMRKQIDVNVHGVLAGMRLALPGMLARGHGHVVNVGSAASRVGLPGEAVYCGTKHFVLGVSEGVRAELRGSGVEITVVMPNLAATQLGSGMSPARGSKLLEPAEVGAGIVGAIERPRFEVSVPRELGFQLRFRALLPVRARDLIGRLLGMDKVATQLRKEERAAYQAVLDAAGGEPEQVGRP
jgi:NADP-dependent 3-hydroxy acid dehydrogenase YdfG